MNFREWWPPRWRQTPEPSSRIAEPGKPAIALIGGTGALGSGLARRWAAAGYPVVIGSRDPAKAQALADSFGASPEAPHPRGTGNPQAATMGDIVVFTLPFPRQQALLDELRSGLKGKLILTSAVPLAADAPDRVPPGSVCAATELQRNLGADARVVSAFHNIPARRLGGGDPIDCDVLVFGDDTADRTAVIGLVEAAGMRGIHGGPLANSAAAEALTSVLIGIGRHYKIDGPTIRITGL